MGRDRLTDTSKKLSWLLRHAAPSQGVAMDDAGWVAVDDVLKALRISRPVLDEVVEKNTKNRLEIRGDRMRASQGHSRDGMPVTLAGLEASWEEVHDDASIWHGTSVDAVRGIARDGIRPAARTHVHCTDALGSAVGKRAKVDVMLEISPARLRARGVRVFRSQNGVILVREVPVQCLVGLLPIVARAQREAEALRALLFGDGSRGAA
ncbi:probable RNA 2'-phosphotransferase [Sorangium cellulosum So ce56]|uniref:Probable RNA 2'-phosphotransferase n=1 Tax=Sorangium cellulosum (strain So ce56) TaxID=448385 RepID=A9FQ53_SORC5|nr:RNA 2'-phosphotransferase [Sorangium cellulosum]CAN92122.1 probable RNA 2'-phosphotransferase [Sorangium cellulosum So ce56]